MEGGAVAFCVSDPGRRVEEEEMGNCRGLSFVLLVSLVLFAVPGPVQARADTALAPATRHLTEPAWSDIIIKTIRQENDDEQEE
jgi:hypothetical protein